MVSTAGFPGQREIPFTPEEELARDKEEADADAKRIAESLQDASTAGLRASALSKLEALGLSLDEIAALNIAG